MHAMHLLQWGSLMNLATYKKFKGDRLMPWGKATVVTGTKGYVFLAGNTATADDYDPLNQRGGAVGDPAMQWRAILANIKSDLEEVGSSLEHLVKLTFTSGDHFQMVAFSVHPIFAWTCWTNFLRNIVQSTAATTTRRHPR